MCGIVGYVGESEAYPILIEALKKLEYRGYDSAGMAVSCDGRIEIARRKGKVDELRELCEGRFQKGMPTPTGPMTWWWCTTASWRTTWS